MYEITKNQLILFSEDHAKEIISFVNKINNCQ